MSNVYYSIQTFLNGNLDKTTWINARNGEVQEAGFNPSADDLIVDAAMGNSPNWEAWNEFMFANAAYNRLVKVSEEKRAISLLETLSLRRFFQPQMITLWRSLIESVPLKPTPLEIEAWNNAVDTYSMPFSFDDNGLMILR